MHTSVDGDEAQGPLPTPGTPPPSHPTPSQVGDGLGRDGAMLSLGGGGGGGARLRLAALAHQGRMDAGVRCLAPTARSPAPSQPTIPRVGEGLFHADGSMKFSELCTLLNSAAVNMQSTTKNHLLCTPSHSAPTHRLRMQEV